MRKKHLLITFVALSLVLCITLPFAGCASTSETTAPGQTTAPEMKPVTLVYNSYLAPPPDYSNASIKWMTDQVESRSQGKVKFEMHYSGELAKATDVATICGQGGFDLGHCSVGYTPALFPLTDGLDKTLTLFPDRPEALGLALLDLSNDWAPYKKEWDDLNLKLIMDNPRGRMVVWAKEPIRTVDGLKGKKTRAMGSFAKALDWIGGTPVAMPAGDVYTSLSTGILDAGYNAFQYGLNVGLAEVSSYVIDLGVGATGYTAPIFINLDSFNKLPADMQQILIDAGRDATVEAYGILLNEQKAYLKKAEEAGVEIIILSDSEMTKFRDIVQPRLINEWIAEAEKNGLPAQDFIDRVLAGFEKYKEQEMLYEWLAP
ncbi:TRAP transporter substrate-binding protein [Chloroflexota bacterium]